MTGATAWPMKGDGLRKDRARMRIEAAGRLGHWDCGGGAELSMTAEQIRRIIVNILARIVPDEDVSHLKDDVPFREQLELDSMDVMDIVMELRKQYRIQIPEEDYPNLTTMAGTVNYLEPRMRDIVAPA